jgi:hypothetical protein
MNQLLRILVCACALLMLPACQTHYHFDKEWRSWSPISAKESRVFPKKKEPAPPPQSSWDGRWAGVWTSSKMKKLISKEPESGEIRCVLSRIDPYRYRANFRAEYHTIFHGEYVATLYGHARGKTLQVKGVWPLSPLVGGDYHYEGTITTGHFRISYTSKYDNGTIEMSKVP